MTTLHNLTKDQVKMAEIIWNIESKEDFDKFLRSIPKTKQIQAKTILELLMMEDYDRIAVSTMERNPIAMNMFHKIGVKTSK